MVTVVAKALFGAAHSHVPEAAGAECFYSVEVVLVTIDYGT